MECEAVVLTELLRPFSIIQVYAFILLVSIQVQASLIKKAMKLKVPPKSNINADVLNNDPFRHLEIKRI